MKMPRKRRTSVEHEFVEFIPEVLEDGKVYVSVQYATATHNCLCGCGSQVVTPIHPTGWQLAFDGDTISLRPSIGNWGFACQSHYWIKRNQVEWAPAMTMAEIEHGRRSDRALTAAYFEEAAPSAKAAAKSKSSKRSIFDRVFRRSSR
jgi:hypothetical protein